MVADCALYSAANITLMKTIKWLCRVPLTLESAKSLVSQLSDPEFIKSKIAGYSYVVKNSNYGGVEQRWLVLESLPRLISDQKNLEKRIEKSEKNAHTKLNKLCAEEFACRQDALKAASQLSKNLKYHNKRRNTS